MAKLDPIEVPIKGVAGTLLPARGRPAETGGATAAIGGLVALLAGVDDPAIVGAIVAFVGLVPAAITGLINAGGISGLARKLWRGRS